MSAADLRRGEFGPGDHGEITGLASRSKSSQKGRRPFLWGLLHEYDIRALLADVRPRVGGLHWGRTVARRGVLSGHLAVECERLGNAKVGGANGAAQRVDAGKSNGQGAEQRHYEDERTGRDAAEVFTELQFICLLRRWTRPGGRVDTPTLGTIRQVEQRAKDPFRYLCQVPVFGVQYGSRNGVELYGERSGPA